MPNSTNKLPIVDWTQQAEQEKAAATEFYHELLSMLAKQFPELQSRIKTSVQKNDLEELESVLHRLHGACAYCGLPRLRETVAEASRTTKATGKISQPLISNIDKEIVAVIKELNKKGIATE